jgi:hypothetical protein
MVHINPTPCYSVVASRCYVAAANNPARVFLIGKVGGVQLGPIGTAVSNRPTGAAPGDYDVGEISGMMIDHEKPNY